MACRDAYKTKNTNQTVEIKQPEISEPIAVKHIAGLLFGVDSKINSNDLLQNNINQFEWVIRNKIYPNFWGRNLSGENSLTRSEIKFLHDRGCKIAAIYSSADEKKTETQGKLLAKKATVRAIELQIPEGTALFLEIGEKENVTTDFMRGFASALVSEGYTPGFKANTDAKYSFDREYSRGLQTDKEIFGKCLVWATSPSLAEYDRITTTHMIHPDNWIPFAPSGIKRNDIAIWQYGKDCHPIQDDSGKETTFDLNLVRNENVIIEKMF